ncbi:protein of unknown function [Kytococcus aerolatus]|uniref:DUF4307 domain-containing protein n=1 Tax=Kytococcus aerolatus TaxID=592308 RepID=A0A212U8C7_9MICO|nr:DUF4307 domain-containing protein [Kytococcus aerolatus]SNC74341.1 protein of unknown function [Kytococcus aerolatus]
MTAPAQPTSRTAEAARRRRWWIIGGVGIALATAVVVWFGLALTAGKVSWYDAGYEDVTDSSVTVIYDVHRDPEREVACRLVAEDEKHAVVGTTEVQVPPSGEGSTRERSTMRTTARPLVGYVTGCWYTDEA